MSSVSPRAGEYAELAVVERCGFIESRHYGSVVVLDPAGEQVLSLGLPGDPVLPRSSVKPVQALGCLVAGAALVGPQLAIAAGSHTGEDMHAQVVRDILAAVSLSEGSLGCPPDWPEDEGTRNRMIRAGKTRERIRMNCSGKHAAMLAASAVNGWTTTDYLQPEHEIQRRIRAELERLTGVAVPHVAVDGCGAPLLALSLISLAETFRRFALAAEGTSEYAVATAMREYPEYVGGDDGHPNTNFMRAVPGLLAKGGAEGVFGAATPDGFAVGVKVIDGNLKVTTAVAIAALTAAGCDMSRAAELATLPVLGGGRVVGEIRPQLPGS